MFKRKTLSLLKCGILTGCTPPSIDMTRSFFASPRLPRLAVAASAPWDDPENPHRAADLFLAQLLLPPMPLEHPRVAAPIDLPPDLLSSGRCGAVELSWLKDRVVLAGAPRPPCGGP